MSSISSDLMQFVWLGFSLLVGTVQIIASVLLLREHHLGPWMMLFGALISLICNVFMQMVSILNFPFGLMDHVEVFYGVTSGISSLGWICFGIGLLLYALHRRSQGHRIAELERMLESYQSRDPHTP